MDGRVATGSRELPRDPRARLRPGLSLRPLPKATPAANSQTRRPHLFFSGLLALACALPAGCARPKETPGPAPASGAPRRVVALAPNLTEIVFAVGAGGTLVGVSEYSDFPPAAQAIPRVGGLEVSAEKVVSLRPDLVLATSEANAKGPVSALAAAGVPVLAVPAGSLKAVIAGIRLVGQRLGRPVAADRLATNLEKRREAVRAEAARSRGRPRTVLLIWPDPPQAAGEGTFLNDLLAEAGGENALGGRAGWPLVSPEWLATAPIDVLVIPDSGQTRAAYERAFREGPLSRGTVAAARVVRIDESVLTRPGPRVFDALEQLARELAR
jgi:iron complex transport system substrate-binding protein